MHNQNCNVSLGLVLLESDGSMQEFACVNTDFIHSCIKETLKMEPKNIASRAYHKARREGVKAGMSPEESRAAGRDASAAVLAELQPPSS